MIETPTTNLTARRVWDGFLRPADPESVTAAADPQEDPMTEQTPETETPDDLDVAIADAIRVLTEGGDPETIISEALAYLQDAVAAEGDPESTDDTEGAEMGTETFARDGVRGPGDGPGGGKGGGAPAGGPAMKRKAYREATGRAAKHNADADQSMKSAKSASEASTAASHYRQAEQSAVGAQNAHEAARKEASAAKDIKAQRFHEDGKKAAATLEQKAAKAAKRAEETGQYALDPDAGAIPELAQDIDPEGEPFYGIVAPEGIPSDDSRQFGPDSMTARDLPLPLMFQDAQLSGHDGAVRVGRIDNVWRDTTTYAVPMIRYDGVWDTSEVAQEAKRQVEAGVAKGVSVDGVNVTTRLVGSNGETINPMDEGGLPEDGVVVEHADEVKMAGLTICSVPAFEQTYIANGRYEDRTDPEPGQTPREPLPAGDATGPGNAPAEDDEEDVEVEALVAAAPAWTVGLVASANGEGDWVVPAAHFTDPGLTEPTALTVDKDGRVYGHLATWGQCHIGQAAGRRGDQVRAAGKCMEVPQSASGYAYFATGVVHTDDGQVVNVGQLTMDTGHANLQLGAKQTVDHYDNTGAPVADIVVGQDAVGIWFSGHVRPTATPAQVYAMTASGSVSGDWREVVRRSNQLELVAALVVNVPGFPIGRPAVTASASGPVALVASGAITPPQKPQEAVYATEGLLGDRALVASLTREVMAGITRTQRAQAAARRIRTHRATKAAARIAKGA